MSEFLHGRFEIRDREIRPALFKEDKFRKRALPQKKIGKTLLAARSNEQVHFGRATAKNFRQHVAERFGRELCHFVEPACGVINGYARRIIDREAEMETSALRGGGLGIRIRLPEGCRQTIPPPVDALAHAFFVAVRRLRKEIFLEHPQDRVYFGSRALPIRGRKRKQRQRVNAHARRGLNDMARRFRTRAMARRTR